MSNTPERALLYSAVKAPRWKSELSRTLELSALTSPVPMLKASVKWFGVYRHLRVRQGQKKTSKFSRIPRFSKEKPFGFSFFELIFLLTSMILKHFLFYLIKKNVLLKTLILKKYYLITNYLSISLISFPNDTAKVRLFLKPARGKGVKNMLYNILFTFIPFHLQIFKDKPPM